MDPWKIDEGMIVDEWRGFRGGRRRISEEKEKSSGENTASEVIMNFWFIYLFTFSYKNSLFKQFDKNQFSKNDWRLAQQRRNSCRRARGNGDTREMWTLNVFAVAVLALAVTAQQEQVCFDGICYDVATCQFSQQAIQADDAAEKWESCVCTGAGGCPEYGDMCFGSRPEAAAPDILLPVHCHQSLD